MSALPRSIDRVSPAREAALRVLEQVEAGRKYAVDELQSSNVSRLADADRRLTTELVMGVLRWRGDLDFQIERLSGKPLKYFDSEVIQILRLGVFQMRHLTRVPKHAAVNECVELVKTARKRSAAGLVNAVLRKCEEAPFNRPGEPNTAGGREYLESARRSIPSWMRSRWRLNFGAGATDDMTLASQSPPRACLRVPGGETDCGLLRRELEESGVQTRSGTYSRQALFVESGSVLATAAWRESRALIQDEASQLVAEMVRPNPGQRVLDVCAAPGMKARAIADALGEGTIVASDRSPWRMRTLGKLTHAAWPEAVRLHKVLLDATRPLPFPAIFDRVLVDAPCSGTGTLARNPEIKWRLRPEDIPRLAMKQTQMLRCGLAALAPGGRLVYSTCSLEPEENQEVVEGALSACPDRRLLGGEGLRHEFPDFAELFDDRGFFRTMPGATPLDGFFAAVMVCD